MAVDGRDPHRRVPRELRCEFERTLKGECCSEKGCVELEGLWLCERHAYRLWLEERVASGGRCWRTRSCGPGGAPPGRDDVVGRLEKLRARSAAALRCILEDLEESRDLDRENGSGEGRVLPMATVIRDRPLWHHRKRLFSLEPRCRSRGSAGA